MATIEDQRRELMNDVSRRMRGTTLSDFAAGAERIRYGEELLRLPSVAPNAWEDLMAHRGHRDSLVLPMVRGDMAFDLSTAVRMARPFVTSWCERFHLRTDTAWIELAVASDLVCKPIFEIYGFESPGLTAYDLLFLDTQDGKDCVRVERMTHHPVVLTQLDADLGLQVWDRTSETWSQFRNRIQEELGKHLEAQIPEEDRTLISPDLTKVNYAWIEWTLARRAGLMSVRATAKRFGVNRRAIDKGEQRVSEILGLESMAT